MGYATADRIKFSRAGLNSPLAWWKKISELQPLGRERVLADVKMVMARHMSSRSYFIAECVNAPVLYVQVCPELRPTALVASDITALLAGEVVGHALDVLYMIRI